MAYGKPFYDRSGTAREIEKYKAHLKAEKKLLEKGLLEEPVLTREISVKAERCLRWRQGNKKNRQKKRQFPTEIFVEKKRLHHFSKCVNIFVVKTDVFQERTNGRYYVEKKSEYFVVKAEGLVPEVLQKVVEAKRLLESEKAVTVQEATEQAVSAEVHFIRLQE